MLGKTHKAGGCLAMLLGFHYLQSHQLLSSSISPFVQLLIMYPVSSWASIAPDLDQNENAIPERTPFSLLVHKLLHIRGCRHRSWQTHSWFVTGLIPVILIFLLKSGLSGVLGFNEISRELIEMILMAFSLGLYSHLLLDSLTMKGVWLIPKVPFRLVPKKSFFGTGTAYEEAVYKILIVSIVFYTCYLLFFVVLKPFFL